MKRGADQEQGQYFANVDWSRTRAYGQRSVHVYVNTKGRDPEGIVEPGREYDAVREGVLKALHEYVDPATGLKPSEPVPDPIANLMAVK